MTTKHSQSRTGSVEEEQYHGHFDLGALAHELGRPRKAVNEYNKEIALTNYYKAHYNLGIILMDRGRYQEAIKHFELVIAARPKMYDAYNYLGIIYSSLEKYDKAIQAFKEACQRNTNKADPIYLANLADAYDDAGQYRQAIVKYRQVLDLAPNHLSTLQTFGDLLIVEDTSVQEGIAYLKRARRKAPNDPQILACLALGYQKQGRGGLAQRLAEKAKRLAPKNTVVAERVRWVKEAAKNTLRTRNRKKGQDGFLRS